MSDRETPEQLTPAPGELTIEQAIELTRAFMKAIDFVASTSIPKVARSSLSGPRSNYYSILYERDALFSVSIREKRVVIFTNERRNSERSKGTGPSGRLKVTDPINGKGFVRRIATKLGVPENYEFVEFKALLDGDPNDFERRYAARLTSMMELMPYGYRMISGAFRDELNVDPVDGAVTYFCEGPQWPYTIESHKVSIKQEDAEKAAKPHMKEYRMGPYRDPGSIHPMPYGKQPTLSATLQFVCPNGQMGGLDLHPTQLPQRLRLAWVLQYNIIEQVWIDAADGRFLGGCSSKWEIESRKAKKPTKE
jgi:hypothetical protein